MFQNLEIPEYNINLINLNYLLNDKIELNIANFLYDNNLNLKLNSRDLNNIFKHFIISEIIANFKTNYNNILIFNFSYNLKYLQNFDESLCTIILNRIIEKSSKIFNFLLFTVEKNIIVDKNLIYQFKQIIEKRKKNNFNSAKKFCEKSNLTDLLDKVKNSSKTKLIMSK
jgi:hypothetical protein